MFESDVCAKPERLPLLSQLIQISQNHFSTHPVVDRNETLRKLLQLHSILNYNSFKLAKKSEFQESFILMQFYEVNCKTQITTKIKLIILVNSKSFEDIGTNERENHISLDFHYFIPTMLGQRCTELNH